jgi:hypothetical protein
VITLRAPAGQSSVGYGAVTLHADPDGTFSVPDYLVPDLIATGCSMADGSDPPDIDVRAAIAGETAAHLRTILAASGHAEEPDDDAARTAALALYDGRFKRQMTHGDVERLVARLVAAGVLTQEDAHWVLDR